MSGHTDRVKTVAVFPDGKRVVSASDDNFVKIWDVASSTCLCTLYGHRYSVMAVAVFPDDKRVVSGSGDKTVKIWDVESGICCVQCQGILIV